MPVLIRQDDACSHSIKHCHKSQYILCVSIVTPTIVFLPCDSWQDVFVGRFGWSERSSVCTASSFTVTGICAYEVVHLLLISIKYHESLALKFYNHFFVANVSECTVLKRLWNQLASFLICFLPVGSLNNYPVR